MNDNQRLYEFSPKRYGAPAFTVIANSKEETFELAKECKESFLFDSFDNYEIIEHDLAKGVKTITYIE